MVPAAGTTERGMTTERGGGPGLGEGNRLPGRGEIPADAIPFW